MTKPKEAIPFQGQDNGPAKPEAPAAAVVAEPPPIVKHFDPKKSFSGTKAVDKLKAYAKEAPQVRARLQNTIDRMEAALREFEHVVVMSKSMLDRWEAEEQEKKESAEASQSS